MKNFFLALFLIPFLSLPTFAIEDISTSSLLSQSEVKAEEIQQLDQIEVDRQKGLENQLGFTLPEYTDNPSYVVTFVDPSPAASGVQLEIDKKEYITITSPYTLPALGIGEHTLKFRFNDKDGNVQLLEYTLIVLPRSPIVNPPTLDTTSIILKGTGLSNSDIILFVNSNTFNHTETVQTDANGDWSLNITPEGGLVSGIYTITGFTRKYGYASELSQPTVFEVGESAQVKDDTKESNIFFSFNTITPDNVKDILSENPDLILLLASAFVFGMFLALLFKGILVRSKEERVMKKVEGAIKSTKTNENEKTLRELFEGKVEKKEDSKEKVSKVKEEKAIPQKKEDKVISKETFLKDYKSIDPDNKEGKENTTKKLPRIKVSLTSREE